MNIYGKYGVPNLLNPFRRSHGNVMLLKGVCAVEREGVGAGVSRTLQSPLNPPLPLEEPFN